MTFYDETLYGRDDEMDEYGDSGAYGETPEEEFEEEEEEEESGMPEGGESETVGVVEVEEPLLQHHPDQPAAVAEGGSPRRRSRQRKRRRRKPRRRKPPRKLPRKNQPRRQRRKRAPKRKADAAVKFSWRAVARSDPHSQHIKAAARAAAFPLTDFQASLLATRRTASDSMIRVTPLMIMLMPTSVPTAHTELDGQCT